MVFINVLRVCHDDDALNTKGSPAVGDVLTVGVSAVRDLYGTVMNEGANKGILVTTADYGPDAYEFAKDKPLTLLSGNNLLHLLAKHGHSARIDLREAKLALQNAPR